MKEQELRAFIEKRGYEFKKIRHFKKGGFEVSAWTKEASPRKRIQRMRTKGWRMPPNTVYVGRPTKYGNYYNLKVMSIETSLECYEQALRDLLEEAPHFLDLLKGKDLACWCPLDKPCHADVLLKVLKEMEG